ncbi:HPr family phosphocarrier protein [Paenibacillus sp. GCM10023248]|uniref:HPr family phosphocarrier protein n=1 Tax=Bacillales TaxID=1385 RepID=UPI002379FE7B|nr:MULTISPECIES: HPr family phosphocarrier protein [Bacillales]MDD9268786.1 HPr family phosphocarrier protein [Paenibacillus sp. MAHUQ-63]MDR6882135.1 phosphotransferase system HPr (HPr) family protein [Bacillus sp. 3255]
MKIEWSFEMNRPWTIDQVLNFVTIANRFKSQIYVGAKGRMLNAKGHLGVVSLSLSVPPNATILLEIEGEDAQEAFEGVAVYLQNEEQRERAARLPSSSLIKRRSRVAQ